MTFLQPFILYGLPLVLLPLVIHLLNRLRYRTQQWAAMRFLISAQKQSIRRSRLRQWLVLLMRMLAVLAIILFLSRPMTGGWSSFFSSGEPEVILLALDRSASMETRLPDGETRRERALRNFMEAASVRESSTVVLVENVYRDPQPLASADDLLQPAMERYVGPTDTSADIPALITTALEWLEENEVGSAEVWVASDLKVNDWMPDGSQPRWENMAETIKKLDGKYALRLLSYDAETPDNARLRCEEVIRRKNRLKCGMTLERDNPKDASMFVEVFVDGERREIECSLEGTTFLWQPELTVKEDQREGWGKFRLPNDGNPGDDEAYFVYGSPQKAQSFTLAENPKALRALATASMNFLEGDDKAPKSQPMIDLELGQLDNSSLLFWQGPLPKSPSSETITDFVEKGGVVVFLPPENNDETVFSGCSWGDLENAPSEKEPFKITSWEQREGPLADTSEGMRLPLTEISVNKRRHLKGDARALAFFQDEKPFFSRIARGKGEIYFLCTLPVEEWSDFSDGFTLVPMAQRLLKAGTRRFDPPASLPCGTPGLAPPGTNWKCIDSPGQKDFHARAGIYLIDGRLVALNRPASEDKSPTLALAECKALLGDQALAALEGASGESSEVPAEIWRIFLFLTLTALLVEALLVMPKRNSTETIVDELQGEAG